MRRLMPGMALLAAGSVIVGCATPLLHPIETPESRVSDPGLVGEWVTDGPTISRAVVTDVSGEMYRAALTIHQDTGFKTALTVDVALTQIGGNTFADLFLAMPEREKLTGSYGFLAIPVHQAAKVVRDNDTLRIWFLDGSWLERTAGGAALPCDRLPLGGGEAAVIVASTPSVRAFLLKHGEDPGAFAPPMVFHRTGREPDPAPGTKP